MAAVTVSSSEGVSSAMRPASSFCVSASASRRTADPAGVSPNVIFRRSSAHGRLFTSDLRSRTSISLLVDGGVSPRWRATSCRDEPSFLAMYIRERNCGTLRSARWLLISVRMNRITAGTTSRTAWALVSTGSFISFAFLIIR